MNKDINGKYIKTSHLFKNFKKISLNHIKNISCFKKNFKVLKIDIPNSNICSNSINNLTTKNYNNTKNIITFDEKNNNTNNINININTEKIFIKKENTPDKKNKSKNKNEKKLNRTNTNKINKSRKLIKSNNNILKKKKNVTPNKNRLSKIYNKGKEKLYITNNFTNKSNVNFNVYNNYNKYKKISTTTKNNNSTNKINSIIYILNKKNNIKNKNVDCFISRNNIKSIFNKEENKITNSKKISFNSINCLTCTNRNEKNEFSKKKLTTYQNFVDKSKKFKNEKGKKIYKSENKIIFNSYNNIMNKNNEKCIKIKSEPKKINLSKKRIDLKNVNFTKDLIKSKYTTNKNSNIIIKRIKYYNSKNCCYENIQKEEKNSNKANLKINYSKRIKLYNKNKKSIKYKTNNNSKDKNYPLNKKYNERKEYKSCEVSFHKLIKRKKVHKILHIKKNNINTFKIKNNPGNKNSTKKIIKLSNNIKYYIKNKKIKTDIHTYNFEDDFYNNILESENDEEKKINEIKTNKFDVKKPKEENLKYTIFKEFNDDTNISESQISKISKIIIGKINGYNDIIEKDKINNLLNQSITKNLSNNLIINNNSSNTNNTKIKKKRISFNESIESEKKIINMINFDDETYNMSTNDFKSSKHKPYYEINNKNLNKNEIIKRDFLKEKKIINSQRYIKIKNEKYNPIKFRDKFNKKINIKIENQKKALKYKSNIKLNNITDISDDEKTNLNKILKTKTKINNIKINKNNNNNIIESNSNDKTTKNKNILFLEF